MSSHFIHLFIFPFNPPQVNDILVYMIPSAESVT